MKKAGRQHKSQNRFRCKVVATAVAACFVANIAYANPTGPVVINGQVSFARAGSVLSVTNSPSSIINWQQFSIAGGETTRFIQQSAASAVLNRVVGVDPSLILGTLQSNGRVFLINPSGIMFGAGSQIDVAGLVASTLRLSNEDFLAGRMNFVADPAQAAAVVNQGRISASPGGQVYLVGTAVDNQGVITAPNGDIVLAAGNSVRVTDGPGSRLQVEIRAPADSAVNLSEAVYGSRGIYGGLVKNSGTISANSVVQTADGRIVLKASRDVTLEGSSRVTANGAQGGSITAQAESGTLLASGTIEATGDAAKGGVVQLLGDRVALLPRTHVDASGETGGGTVLVGGDYQGGNPEVKNSTVTYVGSDVSIKADAVTSGDGGKVIIWADDTTRFYGSVSARGGAQGGDGGFVEVSGKNTLVFKGDVDTRAPKGHTGMLLLDPANIIIANGASDSTDDGDALNNSFSGVPSGVIGTVSGTDNPLAGTMTLFESELQGIAATTSISLAATSNITINDLADNLLNLAQTAGNSVTFNAGGTFSMNAGDTIQTGGGALNFTTTGAATLGGLTTGGGAITINVGADSSVTGVIAGTATTLIKQGAANLTVSGANTYTGATTISAGTLTAANAAALGTTAGSTTIASGATLDINGVVIGAEALNVQGTGMGANGAITGTGTGSLSGGITLAANTTIGGTGTFTLSGVIADGVGNNFSLTKTGAGTLVLTGANTYGTGTNVNQGVLNLRNASAAGSAGTVTVADGAAVEMQGGITVARALTLNGTGVAATGALRNISGANAWSGAITLGSASRVNSDAGTLTLSGGVTGATQSLTVGGAGNTTVGSAIGTTAGTLTKDGAGTLTLSGANTYTGTTTISAGNVTLSGGAAIANTGVMDLQGGTLQVNTAETIGRLSGAGGTTVTLNAGLTLGDATDTTIASTIGGAGGLTKQGTSTVTLSGANTYTGVTRVNAGVLSIDSLANGGVPSNIGASTNAAANLVLAGGTLQYTGATSATDRNFTLLAATTSTVDVTVGGTTLTISGASTNTTGALTKAGPGTLTLSGANLHTGTTTINAGTLQYGASDVLATGAVTVNDGGIYNLAGFSDTIGALNVNSGINGGGSVTTGAGTLTLGGNVTSTGGATNASISGNLALGAATRIFTTTNPADGLTVSAAISGGVGLTKQGAGTVTLSGTNTYTGTTTINAGTLRLVSGSAIADAGVVTLANVAGAILDLNGVDETIGSLAGGGAAGGNVTLGSATFSTGGNNTTTTYTGVVSGTGGLTKQGTGAMTLSGNNSYTGPTTISAGTLTLGAANRIADASATSVASGATFNLAGFAETVGSIAGAGNITLGAGTLSAGGDNSSTSFSGVISGTGGLTKQGTGTLTLSGANLHTGTTTINAGTLQYGASDVLATGAVTVNDGGIYNLAGFSDTIGALNVNSGINGGGSVTTGAGTLTLGGNVTSTGGATNASISGNLALGAATRIFTTTNPADGLTVSAAISGGVGLTKQGAGTVTLSGTNTYTGTTTINAGTLRLVSGSAIADAGVVTLANVAGAILDLNGVDETIGSLAGGGAAGGNVTLGSATFSTGGNNTTTTYTGVVSGTGGLTKQGTGAMTLSGNNSYTGPTTISAGTLTLGAANRIADASATSVASGATFNLAGFAETVGSIAGAGNITLGAGTLSAGGDNSSTSFSGVISGTGGLTKQGTGTLTLSGANTYTGISTLSAGMLSVNSIANVGGGASALGAPTTVANGTIALGAGTLQYTGTGHSSNRVINLTDAGTVDASGGGTLTLTGGVTGAAQNLTLTGTGAGVESGVINTTTGTLTKTGTGTWTLSGANTYIGTTTINVGTLAYGASNVIATGAVTVDGGTAVLDLGNNRSDTVGTVIVANGGSITGTGTSSLTSTGSFEMQDGSVSAILAGPGIALNKTTAGTVTLSGANTYTGTTTISAGNLTLLGGSAIVDSGVVALNGGTLQVDVAETIGRLSGSGGTAVTLNAGLTFGDATDTTIASTIGGAAGLTKQGASIVTLSGANTYSGNTTISAGTLRLGAANVIPDGAGAGNVIVGGTLDLNTFSETINGLLGNGTVDTAAGSTPTLTVGNNDATSTFSGTIQNTAGTLALTKTGTGALTLGGVNTYTGTTTVSDGTLYLSFGSAIADTGAVVLSSPGANLTLNSSETIGSLSGVAVTSVALNANTLTTGDASNTTYAGVIGGTGGLTKQGAGTFTLSGANTYIGTTTINAGTLVYGASNVIATGAVTVDGGTAVLDLGNNRSDTVGTVTVANGGSITGTGTSSLTSTGSFEMQDGSVSAILAGAGIALNKTTAGTLTLSGANTYTGNTTVSAGTLALGANNVLADGSSVVVNGGNFDINTRTDTVAGVQLASGFITGTTGVLTSTSNYDMRSGTASAILAGAVGLDKSTAGTVTLLGANTYGGNTTISSGTLQLGAADVIPDGAGKGNVVVGGTLDMNGFSETINGLAGAGTVDNTAAATTPTVTVGNNDATSTFSGIIQNTAGTLALTKTGTGALTLGGVNTYTGTTTVASGTLYLSFGNAIADTGAVVLSSAGANLTLLNSSETIGSLSGVAVTSVALNANTLTTGDASNTTYSGVIGGTGGLTKQGAGTFTLSGANTYIGTTTLSAGTLALGANNVLADGTSVVVNGGTFDINTHSDTVTGVQSVSGLITGTTGVLTSTSNYDMRSGLVSAILGGAVGLDKTTIGTVTLSGANTYTGTTTINAGTLSLLGNSAISDTSAVVLADVAGAALKLNGTFETIGSLAGGGPSGGMVELDAGRLTAGGDNTSTAYAGVIFGAGGWLTKAGTGTMTLSGANTYTGTTTVSAGTLVASNAAALGTAAGGTTVSSGATLNINNVPIGNEAISIDGNGAGGVGALTGTGTASLSGTLTLAGASRIGTTSGASTLTLGDAVSAGGNTLDITGAGNLTATNALNNFGAVTINSVGNVTLVDANALTISTTTVGTLTARTLSSDLTLGGNVTATGSGNTIVLVAAGNFDNSGNNLLDPNTGGGGRWLVYSTNPASDNRGGLGYNFKQYNATYGVTAVAGTGNGFLYTLAPTITPTLQGTVTKTYDGLTAATLAAGNYKSTGIGDVDGDTVVLSNPAGGVFASTHAATGILVTASSASTLTSATNGAATVYGYQVSGSPASGTIGTIDPKLLTVTAPTIGGTTTKIYDGNTTTPATLTGGAVSGAIAGDTLTLDTGGVTLAYDNAHVASVTKIGAAGSASLNIGASASSSVASDYSFAAPTISDLVAANLITAKALTVTAPTIGGTTTKIYDGNTTTPATLTGGAVSGAIAGDTLTLDTGGVTLAYDNAHVASVTKIGAAGSASLNIGASASSSVASDYSFAAPTISDLVAANLITAKALTVTAPTIGGTTTKIYDGNTTTPATLTGGAVSGAIAGDTLTLDTGGVTLAYDNAHVASVTKIGAAGSASLNIGASASSSVASDYSFAAPTISDLVAANLITAKALTVTAPTIGGTTTKIYDGNTTTPATLTGGAVSGAIAGDTLTLDTGGVTLAYDNAHVASVTKIGAAGSASLNIGASASSSVASDYSFAAPTISDLVAANLITAKALTVTAPTIGGTTTKIYDGNTTTPATLTGGAVSGAIAGDTLTLDTGGVTLAYDNAHVASVTKIGAAGSASLNIGASASSSVASDYSFAAPTISDLVAANLITAKALTVTAPTIGGTTTKIYDGNTTTPATLTGGAVSGAIAGDTLTLDTGGVTLAYDNAHVASVTKIGAAGSASLNIGASASSSVASDYSFAAPTISDLVAANLITAKALTVTAPTIGGTTTKIYDGNTTTPATLTGGAVSGAIAGDTLTLDTGGVTLAYDNAHVASVTKIGAAGSASLNIGASASSSVASDYSFAAPTISDLVAANLITAKALTVTAPTIGGTTTKIYDGNTTTPATLTGGAVSGAIAGDTLTLDTGGVTLAYDNAHVASVTKIGAAGSASLNIGASASSSVASDYSFAAPTISDLVAANLITAKALTVTAPTIGGTTTKIYDGNTTTPATLTGGAVSGAIAGDTLTLDTGGVTLAYDNAHVASVTKIGAAGSASLNIGASASSSVASDYSFAAPTISDLVAANLITAKALTVTAPTIGGTTTKIYDGNTTTPATLTGGAVSGAIAGDTLTLDTGGVTLAYDNAHVASVTKIGAAGSASLNIGASASSSVASDYSFAAPTISDLVAANLITAKALTVTAPTIGGTTTKIYDGNTTTPATLTGGAVSGAIAGDTLTLDTGGVTLAYDNAHVASVTKIGAAGSASLNIGASASSSVASDYSFAAPTISDLVAANLITAKALTVTAPTIGGTTTKIYDGNTTTPATLTGGAVSGAIAGDTLTLDTGGVTLAYDNAHVASVTKIGAAGSASLNIGASASSSVASDYSFAAPTISDLVAANLITAKALTVTAPTIGGTTTKIYDGNTTTPATLTGGAVSGAIAGDTLTLDTGGVTLAYDNAHVASVTKIGAAGSASLNIGASASSSVASDYSFAAPTISDLVAANLITAKALTVTAPTIGGTTTKIYDGNTTTPATLTGGAVSGAIAGDTLTLDTGGVTLAYDNAHVASVTKIGAAGSASLNIGASASSSVASDYSFAAPTISDLVAANLITAKALTVTAPTIGGTTTKIYDGNTTTPATLTGGAVSGAIAGDTLTLDTGGVTLAYDNAHVASVTKIGAAGSASLNIGASASSSVASDYSFAAPTISDLVAANLITAKALTVTAPTIGGTTTKIYDGNTTTPATLTGGAVSGAIAGDTLTLDTGGVTLAYDNAHVASVTKIGAAGSASLNIGASASSSVASDYSFAAPTISDLVAANLITAKALTVTAPTIGGTTTKIYDGNTTTPATLTGGAVSGAIAGDTLTLDTGGVTLAYDNAHVASVTKIGAAGSASLNIGASASSSVASDYSFAAPTISDLVAANLITAKALTVTAPTIGGTTTKIYDGNTTTPATLTGGAVSGAIAGDTLTLDTGGVTLAYDNAHVASVTKIGAAGSASLNIGASASSSVASDYSFAAPTISDLVAANLITAKALTVTAPTIGGTTTKIYDGNTTTPATLTGGAVSGAIAGDTLTLDTGGVTLAYDNAHVASVTKIGAAGSASLNIGASASSSVASDYSFAAPTISDLVAANLITAKALTVTAPTIGGTTTKIYDGNTTTPATLTGGAVSGAIAGDTLTLDTGGVTLAYDNAHVASVTKIGAAGSASLNIGASASSSVASDYSFAAPTISDLVAANLITAKALTVTAPTIGGTTTKIYDGNTTTPATLTGGAVSGAIAGDTLTLDTGGVTLAYDNAHVASVTKIGAAGSASLNIGASASSSVASDYSFAAPTISDLVAANLITAKALTVTAPTIGGTTTKIYDGNTTTPATLTGGAVSGAIAGDTLTLDTGGVTLAYDNAHVASVTKIGAAGSASLNIGASASSSVASDYSFAAPTISDLVAANLITAKALTVTAPTIGGTTTKIYDGNTTTPATLTGGAVSGAIAGDTLTLDTGGVTLAYDNAHVASVTKIGAAGSASLNIGASASSSVASDYSFAAPTISDLVAANLITAKALTVTAPTIGGTTTKIYDGNTTTPATLTGGAVSGAIAGDTLTLDTGGVTLAYDNAHVASVTKIGAAGSASLNIGASASSSVASDYSFAAPTISDLVAANLITAKALTVTASDTSKTYGQTVTFSGTEFTSSGLVGGETVGTVTLSSVGAPATASVVGSPYAISPSVATGGTFNAGDYTITYNNGTLTVTLAPLAITANNASRPVNQPNPPFSTTYSGFQAADTPGSLTGMLSFSTPAAISSPAGPYPITPFGQSSTNYAIAYVNGTLVVSGGIVVPPQIPAGLVDQLSNPLIASLQQLGIGGANSDIGGCSGGGGIAAVASAGLCANRGEEPGILMALSAATTQPVPQVAAALPADKPASVQGTEPLSTPAATAISQNPGQAPKYNDVMTAVMNRDRAAVVELLNFGWWVDRPDSNGLTPLMAAALNGDATITELLLQRGADPNRRAPGGSVLDYAARGGNSKVIELLRRAGAR